MTTENFVAKTYMITPEQWERLRKLAFDMECSQSELVREAIDKLLKKYVKASQGE